jgi:chromosome partitioning protein
MYMGYRVLLVDLDPQSNSTSVFTAGEPAGENTVLDVVLEKKDIKECILHTQFGDIVPGCRELASWDGQLIQAPGGTKRIRKAFKGIGQDYDFILMDTPPNVGAFMRNALFAADGIITPIQAKRFALDGLSDFLDTVVELQEDGNENLKILGVLLTVYDRRNRQDREVMAALPSVGEQLGIRVFKSVIRICQDIENAISDSKSIFRTRGNSNGANDYADLAIELLERIREMEG